MHIALAPFELTAGISEDALTSASDRFDAEFASEQDGIIRRVLVKDAEGGGYADLVFFRDVESIDRVIEAEQTATPAPPSSRLWPATTHTASTRS
jgi:hypothetical protein